MAITPVGNVIHVNQNAHVASNALQNQQQRLDFQNSLASELQKDELEKLKETNPPEQTHKANQDKEQEAQGESDKNGENGESGGSKEEVQEPEYKPVSLLDIRV